MSTLFAMAVKKRNAVPDPPFQERDFRLPFRGAGRHKAPERRSVLRKRWTEAALEERAALYTTREAFRTGPDGSAYQAALRRGRDFLDRICTHMEPQRRTLTREFVTRIAREHRTRTEFAKADMPAYTAALTRGWLDDVCAHMEPPPEIWTRERILAVIPLCESREDLKWNHGGAANAARRMGLRDEIEALLPSRRPRWTRDRIEHEARRYTRRVDFQKGCPAAYKAADREALLDEVCAHMDEALASRSPADLQAAANRYTTPTDFRLGDPLAYRSAVERGLLEEILDRAPIDRDRMMGEAAACAWLGDFFISRRPCYVYAARHGFLETILEKVGPDLEEMREIAAGYSGREAFKKGNLPAYRHASSRGWLDDLLPPVAGHVGPDAPTFVYVYRSGRRVYVGISIDLEMRHGKHLRNSPSLVREIVEIGDRKVLSRRDARGARKPVSMPRHRAERMEHRLILRYAAAGYEVLNRFLNPQYDYRTGRYSWA